MLDEGYIKFKLKWNQEAAPDRSLTRDIVRWRNRAFTKGYIGIKDGVGYGNISVRYKNTGQFIISGTQTGGLKKLSIRHFTLVTKADFEKNTVICKGPVKASAESLTHAMFYRLDENINCVLHIHHLELWNRLKNKLPTTAENVPYGTVEMSREVERLYISGGLREKNILVMAGHEEGIISFGRTCAEAMKIIDEKLNH